MTNSVLEKCSIHPSAVIHPSAEIAEGVTIGPNVVIGEGVKLGKGTRVIANAYIEYRQKTTTLTNGYPEQRYC